MDTIFIRKIPKVHNSVKNVGGVSVLVLCTSSDDGLYFCTKFHEIISNGIRVMEQTQKVNRWVSGQTDGWRAQHNMPVFDRHKKAN